MAKEMMINYQAGKGGPLSQSYQDLETFIAECLVRALDHRMRVKLEARDSATKQAEDMIADMTRQGLTLTRPFYLLLERLREKRQALRRIHAVVIRRTAKERTLRCLRARPCRGMAGDGAPTSGE